MAEDKLLSMSLDDIIKMKKASGKASSSRSSSQTRVKVGTRGTANFSALRRTGRIGVASNRNLSRGGVKGNVPYFNNRGTFRKRGYHVSQNLPVRIEDRRLQREHNIALARSRLQMAKRFLNSRQRIGVVSRRDLGGVGRMQFRRMSVRGSSRGIKRGRGGLRVPSELVLNTLRSDHLSRLNAYRNKVNRSQSAALRNQVSAAPSLIVSIENERAGSAAGLVRGRRGMRKRGNLNRLNLHNMQLASNMYVERNPTPFHTGALNPEIQRMIADIQGKTNPTSGRIANRFSPRGSVGVTRGFGMGRGQRGLSRGQFASRQLGSRVVDGLNVGLPMTTACTLNERFGGRM